MDWVYFLAGPSSSALCEMPRSTPVATIGLLGTQLRRGNSGGSPGPPCPRNLSLWERGGVTGGGGREDVK
uniref:Uncharacterized protein n=1 Tax=Arundo donax TaxID=35708 RepID=A0A0A9ELK5_ARUDO